MDVFMSDRDFSDFQILQHSGKGIPLFMTGHKNCLHSDYMLGPGPRLIKKNLLARGLTKVEKNCSISTKRRATYAAAVKHKPTEAIYN
jgi:hypothetical protein